MKTVEFFNTSEFRCGVFQYGMALCKILTKSTRYRLVYRETDNIDEARHLCSEDKADAMLVNWFPAIPGWQSELPKSDWPCKQILVYHDWECDTSKWDAVFFSDPTMEPHDNWHPIPRPLPLLPDCPSRPLWSGAAPPVIGVHGFFGANAHLVVKLVMEQFDQAVVRMHLPSAFYGDAQGGIGELMANTCRELVKDKPGITLEITHHWMSTRDLLVWLHANDLNCYLRDTFIHWPGVSSALDAALGSYRPLAINKCEGFRHAFKCTPSICVEDRTLPQILSTGVEPILNLIFENRHSALLEAVENILDRVISA